MFGIKKLKVSHLFYLFLISFYAGLLVPSLLFLHLGLSAFETIPGSYVRLSWEQSTKRMQGWFATLLLFSQIHKRSVHLERLLVTLNLKLLLLFDSAAALSFSKTKSLECCRFQTREACFERALPSRALGVLLTISKLQTFLAWNIFFIRISAYSLANNYKRIFLQ